MVVLVGVVAGCGRLGFDDLGGAGGSSGGGGDGGRDAAPTSCVMDSDCGLCQRCSNLMCSPEPFRTIIGGHRSTCFLGSAGRRWCIGEYAGMGSPTNVAPFLPRSLVGDDGWTTLTAGYTDAYGLRNGELVHWHQDSVPVVDNAAPPPEVIASDSNDTCIVDNTTHTVTCDGGTVAGTWLAVSAGNAFECGVQTNGGLYCWGTSYSNCLGQVVPDSTVIAAPTQVGTATDWVDVSVGDGLACAMKTDQTLWCWGASEFTGTNFVDTMGTPTQLSNDTDWTGFRVRWHHGCAFKSNGAVQCWGGDEYGLEVVAGSSSVAVPSDVVPGTGFFKFELGGHHYCAVPANSSTWQCWGWNAAGQLVNGDTTTRGYAASLAVCTPP